MMALVSILHLFFLQIDPVLPLPLETPEFEYYLKTSSSCGSAKWPDSGYQTVTVF